ASELSAARMNTATTFSLLSTDTNVFDFPAPKQLTIPNNGTSVAGSATTYGAGPAQIVAQASATGIDQGATSAITVQPQGTGGVLAGDHTTAANGPANATTLIEINGNNLLKATGIAAPSGITATITNLTSTKLSVSVNVGSGVGSGGKTLTLQT